MNAPLRVLVVDDEPLARAGMAALVAREPGFVVVGECHDGQSAVTAIDALAPDVVLLDVQMPGLDGFDVLARAAPSHSPQVIFVTAHEEHALRAFEVAAIDYVLKPFEDRRFQAALVRARARQNEPAPTTLVAGCGATRVLVREDELDWIEAADYCVRLHAGGRVHLLRMPLAEVAKRLNARFVRVHRGAVVRVDRIARVRRMKSGGILAVLRDGAQIRVSRRGWSELTAALRSTPTCR